MQLVTSVIICYVTFHADQALLYAGNFKTPKDFKGYLQVKEMRLTLKLAFCKKIKSKITNSIHTAYY